MAERLLLTGATGFVGRALVGPLQALGFELHAVTHGDPPAIAGPRWHRADLLDEGAARALVRDLRPALLVHAAWYVVHGRFWTAPENEAWLEASDGLAAAFAEAGGRRFLGIGTCAEYADADGGDDAPWPETRRIAPATPYGRAKAGLARRLAALAERRAGFSVAWARLFHLFGEGEHPDRLVPSVALALAEGREARCASGRPVRDFASTRFVGEALAGLAASGVTGAVNVASGEGRSIAVIVRLLGEAAGRPHLVRLGALPDRPGEVPRMVADVTRLRRDVGFAAPPRVEEDLCDLVRALPTS
ncbi:NAD-dependent epimerase/dehydratase family protein [Falsiroseomonas oryzae]|uniref:NAD-dependent epimerase/dehydratase family protein n=1 Tax=Falsiroseomonas oryzae TaxID=2766473 RepID=UPI0022EB0E83|nr:NAD(P)-dependent oxidoreductase [Roseomonas sp. MO-31]